MKTVKYTFIALVALVFLGGNVQAQILYGTSHDGADGLSTLHIINKDTGAATPVGLIGFERCGSMDFNAHGLLFAICERADGSDIAVLVEIDPETGVGTEVGPTDNCDAWTDMAFRNGDDTLFATGLDVSPPSTPCNGGFQNWLATISTKSGLSTLLGRINQVAGGGNAVAFSQADILYYLVADFSMPASILYTINQDTGNADILLNVTYPQTLDIFPRANAMAFEPTTEVLFLSIVNGGGPARENFLGTIIDIDTGVVTVIGPTVEGLDAIAFSPPGRPIPTLSEWGLIAMAGVLGIVGFIVMRRRKVTV